MAARSGSRLSPFPKRREPAPPLAMYAVRRGFPEVSSASNEPMQFLSVMLRLAPCAVWRTFAAGRRLFRRAGSRPGRGRLDRDPAIPHSGRRRTLWHFPPDDCLAPRRTGRGRRRRGAGIEILSLHVPLCVQGSGNLALRPVAAIGECGSLRRQQIRSDGPSPGPGAGRADQRLRSGKCVATSG